MSKDEQHDLEIALDHLLEDRKTLWSLPNNYSLPKPLQELVNHLEHDISTVNQHGRGVLEQLTVLQCLIQNSASINSSLELDQVLEEIIDAVIAFTGAERAYLMLKEQGSGELAVRSARNWDQETIKQTDAEFSRSIVTTALEGQQPVVTTNAQQDQRFGGVNSIMSGMLLSVLCIPLVWKGTSIGVLYADSRVTQGLFRDSLLPLLTAFGMQATLAIQNASQYAQVQGDLKEAQQEVQKLRVEIDRRRVKEEIEAVTGSDYFQQLAGIARERRAKRHDS